MKILLYVTNFSPELTGSGKFNGELAEWFSQRGHKIDVITSHPYYPQWEVHEGYKKKGWFTEYSKNLRVWRTPLYVPKQPTGRNRIFHELSFVVNSIPYWIGALFRRYDVVISVCPPMQVGLFPYLYSLVKKIPFVFHIQDLQVDAARTLGLIKNKRLLTILSQIENFLLNNATVVSSISVGMKNVILSKGVSVERFFMLPNWVNTEHIKPLYGLETFRSKFGFTANDTIVLYAGNLGEKQGVDGILSVAQAMRNNDKIKFLISGFGAVKHLLIAERDRLGLTNVHFSSPVPYEEFPQLLSMADIHVVVQKRGMSDLVLPSKLTAIFSAGGAAIVTAEHSSVLSSELLTNDISDVVPPEDTQALEQAILALVSSPSRLAVLRANARRYAIEQLSQDIILSQFEDFLLDHVRSPSIS